MTTDTLPTPLDALARPGGAALDEFRLVSPVEIRALLARLVDAGALLHLHTPEGAVYTTTLWSVDAPRDRLAFACDASSPQLQRILGADDITVVGYLDSVKLQFDLRGAILVNGARASTLAAPLPRELFRFQRRASFRVRPPVQAAALARLLHPAAPEGVLSLRVLDVSAGGVALFLPDDGPRIEPGSRLRGVQLALDADTCLQADLEVHHVTAIQPELQGARLGCAWVGLDGDAERALQVFIDQTQKRRNVFG